LLSPAAAAGEAAGEADGDDAGEADGEDAGEAAGADAEVVGLAEAAVGLLGAAGEQAVTIATRHSKAKSERVNRGCRKLRPADPWVIFSFMTPTYAALI